MTDWFDAENHATRAFEMFERGRWAEAEMELRKALAFHPDQPEWLYHLGIVLESSGRDLQAKASLRNALTYAMHSATQEAAYSAAAEEAATVRSSTYNLM